MSDKYQQKEGLCSFCGKFGPLTVDHIPPKSFFPKPRPRNLITVPACEECNSGSSDNDVLMRAFIILLKETQGHHASSKISEKVKRCLLPIIKHGKETQSSISEYILNLMIAVKDVRIDGINQEYVPMAVEQEKVQSFFDKIFRALYFINAGRPFPKEMLLKSWPIMGFVGGTNLNEDEWLLDWIKSISE
jgi:hypothetical protein